MAIGIHVATIVLKPVSAYGTVINKDTASMLSMLESTEEHRVMEDASIPNTAGFPTIANYLKLEADDNYIIRHLDQYMIITYDAAAINAA